MSNILMLFFLICVLLVVSSFQRSRTNRRKGRTLFHEDQDVLITMIIVIPYYFPLWERFYNTSVELGTDVALAEFPQLPPGGLSPCGPFCRKRRSLEKRTGRSFQYDEQVVYFLIELIAAYPVPIIPNPYAAANRKPMRPKNDFNPLPGLTGLREVAGLFSNMFGTGGDSGNFGLDPIGSIPQGIDNIGVQAPIRPSNRGRTFNLENDHKEIPVPIPKTLDDLRESVDNNQTNQRNLCFSTDLNFRSSRSIEENCFLNTKNTHILSAYERVTIDRKKGVSTLRLNWSSLMSAITCHFTDWSLKRTNFLAKNVFLGSIKTVCSNTRLVMFFSVFQKYCKCLILKKLI